ncbi:MAG TPA: amino acid adenylation domain-containing protein [Roseiflexaceae bacterium]|nr:amino acid adenylation domain-containing protein [Roseiflexaceae bacterium]
MDVSHQIDLLADLLGDDDFALGDSIPPRPPGEQTLSFGQERLWFLEQLKPGTPTYHIVGAFRLEGPLRADALERSFQTIVQRHEVLQSTVRSVEGQAVLAINAGWVPRLPVTALAGGTGEQRWREAQRLIEEETQTPFDLERGPLIRMRLLRLADHEHVLVLCMHHLVADGWSMGIFFQELQTCYRAAVEGRRAALPDLPIQYADVAHWQRQELQSDSIEQQLRYWTERLQGSSLVLTLPSDHLRPAAQSTRGQRCPLTLPPELTRRLKLLSNSHQATLFMTLLAAFETLLYRYTDQPDILVGTPIANRQRPEVEGMIGVFINTLVLRNSLSADQRFAELLAQVRETTLGAYANQDVPFELLVKRLRPEHDMGHTPLFQVMFVFQNTPEAALRLPDIVTTPLQVETGTAKFDLTLTLEESPEGLHGTFEYNSDLFERVTIQRLIGHFLVLLEGIVDDPAQRLGDLPLLGTDERRLLTDVLNPGASGPPPRRCLHELFEEQAARMTSMRAVGYEQEQLSYHELNERANQLAHYLRTQGVGPDVPVALCLQRSLDMVVAILGVLKAGGAYLPLDLAYPTERLALMLDDACPPVLLTQTSLLGRLPEGPARVVCLDADWPVIGQHSRDNPTSQTGPANLAYIIYTSGSTGRPKGVMISHDLVVRLFDQTHPWYRFDEHDVWTLFHSYAFDFSVWELWGALLYGGQLVVVPFEVSRSPADFYQLLRRERVTVLNQTPSAFRQLIAAEQALPPSERSHDLRLVIFGGEALELQSLRPWFEQHGDALPQLVNMYGITETTVHVSFRPISMADLDAPLTSPIGLPIPDLQIYVLDRRLNLAPVGVPGEIYVGGAGLARGYLHRPALTAERFIPNPFSRVPGARLYKTGDLARYRPNGQLDYLGRCDDQVKVRGFRIELGDIESALVEHPAVREATVVTLADQHGDKQLVAYLVEAPPEEDTGAARLSHAALREFLKARIPEYMVPSAFVVLPRLPLTPNGKIDRRALPRPSTDRPDLDALYVAPATPAQAALAEIWSAVLEIERIGIHDNFFALGGDSIRSVRVLALARARGLHFSLEQFFRAQTIAELAGEISGGDGPSAPCARGAPFALVSPADRPRLPGGLEDAYPLSRLQVGMLYHMAITSGNPVYHNVDSFELRGPLDAALLREAVRVVVARHPILRTSFDLSSYSEPLQLVHTHAVLPVVVEDIRHQTPEQQRETIQALVRAEKQRPFDQACPPLIRFHLYHRSDTTFQFTLTECHAIFDGWSLTSTLAEIFRRYAALLTGAAPESDAPLASMFRDSIQLEREAIASPAAREFWASRLSDASPIELPRRPTPYQGPLESRMDAEVIAIPPAVFENLNRLVRSAGVPLKSILLAAHLKVLSVASGQQDLTMGMTFNGRPEEQDGDQVRGLFVNTLPLRMQLRPGTWAELIGRAFEAEREILPFRHYPLADIQQQLGLQSLAATTFNFVHFHALDSLAADGVIQIGELSFSSNDNHFALAASFSLNQMFWTQEMPLSLFLQYDQVEFSREQVAALGRYYVETLQAMVRDPQARHEHFSPLASAERRQVLEEWNATDTAYPREATIPLLFGEQVARTPDAVALVDGALELSYAELDARANRLAHRLRTCGVGPETPVALCLGRSVALVVGILATLKAGGTYVPLDPSYPAERLALMLEDSGARVLLTGGQIDTGLPDRLVRIDLDREDLSGLPADPPDAADAPDQLAYLMYTSGSTGTPKGIGIPQRAVIRLVRDTNYILLGPHDRVAHLSNTSFDAATFELWGALLCGGRLVIVPREVALSPLAFADLLREQQITAMFMTTALFNQFAREVPDAFRGVGTLMFGGEACDPACIRAVLHAGPPANLLHVYGPTESTTFASWHRITAVAEGVTTVPIGAGLANTLLYVLDGSMQPVPVGVPGELYIGGDGLARGYWQRPDLTAERFVPNPFGGAGDWGLGAGEENGEPRAENEEQRHENAELKTQNSKLKTQNSRLYRTGDLVRWLPDGALEFIGRRDGQIKLRGFRIELGEIEHALGQHPDIASAVVQVWGQTSQERQLVAYLVPRAGAPVPPGSELRAFLKASLPAYMVPALYVTLEQLPLNANGKIDRRALPPPGQHVSQAAGSYTAPASALEQTIARVWQDCLQISRVGSEDNFFELGGHSLLMIQAHSRLREQLKREFPITEMFRCPTVSSLAAALSGGPSDSAPAERIEHKLEEGKHRMRSMMQRQRGQRTA